MVLADVWSATCHAPTLVPSRTLLLSRVNRLLCSFKLLSPASESVFPNGLPYLIFSTLCFPVHTFLVGLLYLSGLYAFYVKMQQVAAEVVGFLPLNCPFSFA